MRIGHGYDVHQLTANIPLIIGGVKINHKFGLAGHSDGDVLLHAVSDAMLGASAMGSIGDFFPSSNPDYKGIDSRIILRDIVKKVYGLGYKLFNLDATIIAQQPLLRPYIEHMRQNIAQDCLTELKQISVKATTTDNLGFIGREQGIAAHVLLLLA